MITWPFLSNLFTILNRLQLLFWSVLVFFINRIFAYKSATSHWKWSFLENSHHFSKNSKTLSKHMVDYQKGRYSLPRWLLPKWSLFEMHTKMTVIQCAIKLSVILLGKDTKMTEWLPKWPLWNTKMTVVDVRTVTLMLVMDVRDQMGFVARQVTNIQ